MRRTRKPITDFPDNFKSYCKANQDRIQQARQEGREPYFLAHNQRAVDEILNPKTVAMVSENQVKQAPPKQSNLPKTPAQKKAEWETDLQTQGNHGHLTQDECTAIAQNMVDIEQALGVAKGDFMTYEQADKQSANPKYVPYIIKDANGKRIKNLNYIKSRDEPYTENCQTCAPAYLLRLRGFDITAKPYTKGSKSNILGRDIFAVWVNVDGTQVTPIKTRDWMLNNGHKRMSESLYLDYFNEVCKEVGVYEIGLNFKGGGGHATILQRFPDGTLKYIEPQRDNSKGNIYGERDLSYLASKGTRDIKLINFDDDCAILRIDNKVFDINFLSIFAK